MRTPENLRRKPAEGKRHSAKREIPLNHRDYNEFSALCYKFNSLRFDSLPKRKILAFIAEN